MDSSGSTSGLLCERLGQISPGFLVVPFTEEEAVEEAAQGQQLVKEERVEQGQASMGGWGTQEWGLPPA
jgi:hypothetical protein